MVPCPPAVSDVPAKLHVLKEQAAHHHEEEEAHLFPKVWQLFPDAALDEMGGKLSLLQEELLRGEPRNLASRQTDEAAALE